jgi:hypothetical protein
MGRIIDEMPTQQQVLSAEPYQIVAWHLYLRPTMSNDELHIVKAIARRYDAMVPSERERHTTRARRQHA